MDKTDRVIFGAFEDHDESDFGDSMEFGNSTIKLHTNRYKLLPAAIVREWSTYKPYKRVKLRNKMKRLRESYWKALVALSEMDQAFADLSDERDNMDEFRGDLQKMLKRDTKRLKKQKKKVI